MENGEKNGYSWFLANCRSACIDYGNDYDNDSRFADNDYGKCKFAHFTSPISGKPSNF